MNQKQSKPSDSEKTPDATAKLTQWQKTLDKKDLEILRRTRGTPACTSATNLAMVAIQLSNKYYKTNKEGITTAPQRYFIAADELLLLAKNFLKVDRPRIVANAPERVHNLELLQYDNYTPIDQVIAILPGKQDGKAKSVYEKSLSLCSGKAAEHERDHGNVEKGFGML
ncbi:MAG: hypothetical protein ACYC23_24325, partial [Limisphaerales bacterium]